MSDPISETSSVPGFQNNFHNHNTARPKLQYSGTHAGSRWQELAHPCDLPVCLGNDLPPREYCSPYNMNCTAPLVGPDAGCTNSVCIYPRRLQNTILRR